MLYYTYIYLEIGIFNVDYLIINCIERERESGVGKSSCKHLDLAMAVLNFDFNILNTSHVPGS